MDRAAPADRDLAVALVWSAKESALKALRQGLRLDTRSVEATLDPAAGDGEGWRPLGVRHGERRFAGWWRPVGGHVLTVATDPPCGPPALRRQQPRQTSRRLVPGPFGRPSPCRPALPADDRPH